MTEIIVALDVETLREAEELTARLHGTISFFKVGLQLFTAHGKKAVELVQKQGGKVFLDLKLFDIPQTVANAVREAQRLGVHSVSLHLLGGTEMLKAAAAVTPRPKLWGVTVLTSMGEDDVKALHPEADVRSTVSRLAKIGKAHGIDAVICSAQEVPFLRETLGSDMPFVTPGIRPSGSSLDDQRRVMTPAEAARAGIRCVVVGRPITKAADPLKAAQGILAEMKNAAPSSLERSK